MAKFEPRTSNQNASLNSPARCSKPHVTHSLQTRMDQCEIVKLLNLSGPCEIFKLQRLSTSRICPDLSPPVLRRSNCLHGNQKINRAADSARRGPRSASRSAPIITERQILRLRENTHRKIPSPQFPEPYATLYANSTSPHWGRI